MPERVILMFRKALPRGTPTQGLNPSPG
jgi:hypothetical protein